MCSVFVTEGSREGGVKCVPNFDGAGVLIHEVCQGWAPYPGAHILPNTAKSCSYAGGSPCYASLAGYDDKQKMMYSAVAV